MPQPAQDNSAAVESHANLRPIRMEFLDGLRGLAALYVVLFHFTASRYLVDASGARLPLPLPLRMIAAATQYGHYAVAIFIALSGYSLMLPVAGSDEGQLRGGFAGYLKRRAWRILPPYYAALLLSLICLVGARQWREVNWGTVGSHLLLVHNLNPDWNMAINIPLWSVATEWDIYFVFPLLLLPLWRKWGMGAAMIAAFGLGWLPHFALPPAQNLDWACPWYLGLFSLGMGAATVSARSNSRPATLRPGLWNALAALWAMLFLAVALLRPLWMEQRQWLLDPLIGLFAACLILACADVRWHRGENAGPAVARTGKQSDTAARRVLLQFVFNPYSGKMGVVRAVFPSGPLACRHAVGFAACGRSNQPADGVDILLFRGTPFFIRPLRRAPNGSGIRISSSPLLIAGEESG